MATLIWTESAVADLEEIGQFISKDNPPAAEKVGSNIIREAEKTSLPFLVLGASFQNSATRNSERSSLNRIELFINSTKKAI
jgi:plasmid stabilization system protein ParE